MSQGIKSIISRVVAIVMVVLTVVGLVFNFAPVISLNTSEYGLSRDFEEGSITGGISVDKVDFSLMNVVTLGMNMDDISFILAYQGLEREIEESAENGSYNMSAAEELQELVEDLDEDYLEELEEKLEDEGFVNALAMVYSVWGMMSSSFEAVDNSDGEMVAIMSFVWAIVAMLFIIGLLGMALGFAIALIISSIKKIISVSKNFMKADEDLIHSFSTMTVLQLAMNSFMMFMFIKLILGPAVTLGSGVLTMIIVGLAGYLIEVVINILFNKEDRISKIVRQGISLVSMILLFVMITTFVGNGVFYRFLNDYNLNYIDEEAYMMPMIMLVLFVVVPMFLMNSTLNNSIQRFGMKGKMARNGGEGGKVGTMRAMAIVLLVCTIIIPFLGTDSYKKYADAIEDDSYKIHWDAVDDKKSDVYLTYQYLEEAYDEGKDAIADYEDEIDELDPDDDEELIEEMEAELAIYKRYLAQIEYQMNALDICKMSAVISVIVLAVLLVGCEFVLDIVPPIITKKSAARAAAAAAAAEVEAPAEEAPAEEAPAEEAAPAEETPTV